MTQLLTILGAMGTIILVEDHPYHDHLRHILVWMVIFISVWYVIYHTDEVKKGLATGWHALTFQHVEGAKP